MSALFALILKLVGVGFLIVAGIGVIRFSDVFQRMHAATKAGTLGAGLVVMGAVVAHGTPAAVAMGLLTIVFLLLTVPVAGHLLGRASYISGANMAGLKGEDALNGVLERRERSLEERLLDLPGGLSQVLLGEEAHSEPRSAAASLPDLSEVKTGVIYGHVNTVFPRALAIAQANRARISAHVLIDTHAIETARDPQATRSAIRERAARAMGEIEAIKGKRRTKLAINYEEGDPRKLLTNDERNGDLLVLPREGWFHHGDDAPRPGTSWEPDGLLHLPECHKGPVLFVGTASQTSGRVVVHDLGEDHLPSVLDWALLSNLWEVDEVAVVGRTADGRKSAMNAICDHHSVSVSFMAPEAGGDCVLPPELADADTIIAGSLPRPLRTRWYGHCWYERFIPGFAGDILVATR